MNIFSRRSKFFFSRMYVISLVCIGLFITLPDYCSALEEDVIVVSKKGVVYKFLRADKENEDFAVHEFPRWENETFDVFDRVKDPEGIAIDIGAWIGTTAIWLSKNFHHVIAIEADKESIKSITQNLTASECPNVTLCPYPVSNIHQDVVFGPRGSRLNESISCIKDRSNNPLDYSIKSLTLKQIIFDYIYSDEKINARKISFIKCDIEGGEENILEDVLHFAYYNKVPVYMSFHLDWWKSKNIADFEYLFKHFTVSGIPGDVGSYIRSHPFCSLLFEPRADEGVLIKKNMTAVIIGYNLFTYIKNMVSQLEKYTSDIIVIDNNSDFQPLLDYYANDYKHTLLKFRTNIGYTVYTRDEVQKLVGDVYILTDPDLQFNPNLPDHFIQDFIDISNHFQANRVGFALLIDADDIRMDISCLGRPVKVWEQEAWMHKLIYQPNLSLELYTAAIDTTFCLINRRFMHNHIRVAGDFTCKHLPWHTNFRDFLQPGEYESYLRNNNSTHWFPSNK